ncbi:MAG: DUF4276 family protein [Thiotrichales bacterium]|nr:DUF4276 family protein [Thiotrichales bacterium]
MKRVYVMVEGQTEETFVREVLYDHFFRREIYIEAILVETKRGFTGGLKSYAKVKPQIIRQCREKHNAWVTTMFDLYALPNDFPAKNMPDYMHLRTGQQKAQFLQEALAQDIDERHFIPNLVVHEFEALLFSNVQPFADWTDQQTVQSLQQIVNGFTTPEDINDGPQTAPSKRILQLMPQYDKVVQGALIANDIGLDQIRQQCSHFDGWLTKIESIA